MIVKGVFILSWILFFCADTYAKKSFVNTIVFSNQTITVNNSGNSLEAALNSNLPDYRYDSDNSNVTVINKLLGSNYDRCCKIDLQWIQAVLGQEKYHELKNAVTTGSPWLMIELGNFCYKLGEYSAAEGIYLFSLNKYWNRREYLCLLTALNNIGLCRMSVSDYPNALKIFKKTLYWAERFKLKEYIVLSKLYISEAYASTGQKKASFQEIEQIVHKLSQADRAELQLFVKCNIGEIFDRIGKRAEAIDTYRGVVDQCISSLNCCSQRALYLLSRDHFRRGEFSVALSYALEAETSCDDYICSADKKELYDLIFLIYRKSGEPELALKYYIRSEEIKDQYFDNSTNCYFQEIFNKLAVNQLISDKRVDESAIYREKLNSKYQARLNSFLVLATGSLVMLMIFMKGFDLKAHLLFNRFEKQNSKRKLICILGLLLYFAFFYYCFLPAAERSNLFYGSGFKRLLAGIYVFVVTTSFVYFSYGFYKNISDSVSPLIYHLAFILPFFVVIASFVIISISDSSFTVQKLLSISIFVFASYLFPFFIFFLISEKMIFTNHSYMIELANSDLSQISSGKNLEEVAIVRSERTSATLEICINSFIAAEAQGNYCMFYIRKNAGIQRRVIHISLKSLIDQLSTYQCIVRCHKSFVVNLNGVREIRGNSRGYVFYFSDEVDPVPISRNYQKSVMDSVKKIKESLLNNKVII